jgi:hypothetical protein
MFEFHVYTRFHVSLNDYKEIVNDRYTVKRTSGKLESGWKISHESLCEEFLDGPSATKYCPKDTTRKWRIFLDNNKMSYEEHRASWRRLETIHPTRLNGDEEAIKIWRQNLLEILEPLELKRLETHPEFNSLYDSDSYWKSSYAKYDTEGEGYRG